MTVNHLNHCLQIPPGHPGQSIQTDDSEAENTDLPYEASNISMKHSMAFPVERRVTQVYNRTHCPSSSIEQSIASKFIHLCSRKNISIPPTIATVHTHLLKAPNKHMPSKSL
ncbi:hypothetical protein SOMG_02344 [Schizosaccharomyces osmophilus]|uniref:Uncharacterized protein n=1 Tax=Schizosaccharomyces osmophilus TaxID=2545709 RepID=A0AAE9WBV7_9SCHI|nr:uncharacterized protein SOMG_02344 [Schizosaccharomyces osmophilus]WBW73048.1 hypothetical protein SOMG_02344 [Schizosaccharomyces osmophilus]